MKQNLLMKPRGRLIEGTHYPASHLTCLDLELQLPAEIPAGFRRHIDFASCIPRSTLTRSTMITYGFAFTSICFDALL